MESRRTSILLAIGAIVLAALLFVVLGGGGDEDDEPTPTAATTTTAEPDTSDQEPDKPDKPKPPEVPILEIKGGQPVGGPLELSVKSGETLAFEVRADAPDELHLHGYEKYYDVAPGKPTDVSLDADLEGVFELESHTTGVVVAEISVTP